MNISDDLEVYKLSKLLQIFGEENNSDFLYKYWVKSNKLKYLPKVLAGAHKTVAADEVQYVIALESLLESFVDTLKSFIREPYCYKSKLTPISDTITIQQCNDLIVEFDRYQRVSFNAGWVDFYRELSEAVAKVTAKINRLIASYSTGKTFHFVTNVDAEDFISGKYINYTRATEKYFIIDK